MALLARALAAVGGGGGGRGEQRRAYHTTWIARDQHPQRPQPAAPAPSLAAPPGQQQPPQKKPPPPSRAVLAVGRVARMRWVTVAGVVALGVGGIMAADWAAESLVNWWQGKQGDGEDDF